MIRVLVCDDSPTARGLLVAILRGDPELAVVGEARDGVEAVALAQQLSPDVVTMDIQMPRLDGLAATKEIMITAPRPIVVITGLASHDVEIAMHALRAGAVAVLAKPPGPEAPGFADAAGKIVETVKTMSKVKVVRHWRPTTPLPERAPPAPARAAGRGSVVAIATSTGGPGALHRILSGLPGTFPAPILVVQHITPGFTAGLADWLNKSCDLTVKVAEAGERLAPQTAYLAPDDRHLGASPQGTVMLSAAAPVGGFRPSGTVLFESVARGFGPAVIALILTGMGEDGVEGLRAVRAAGGRVIAQDEASCVVFGMPGAAVAARLADVVLPLDAVAARLAALV